LASNGSTRLNFGRDNKLTKQNARFVQKIWCSLAVKLNDPLGGPYNHKWWFLIIDIADGKFTKYDIIYVNLSFTLISWDIYVYNI